MTRNQSSLNVKFDPSQELSSLVAEIRAAAGKLRRIVFVWGNFNVVHPGHLRLLNFAAECGDFLVVGVTGDRSPGAIVPEHLRLEGVRAISSVDYAFQLRVPPEDFIALLQPSIVVKGKEHEQHLNSEQAIVEQYGGKLLFSSGEARFSSMDILQRELRDSNLSTINKSLDYPERHGFDFAALIAYLRRFATLRVVVLGDLIIDEFITCDPIGMSQEDPTIVVTPIKSDLFIGGAGIVAAHARGLGAQVKLFSVAGCDGTAEFANEKLCAHGVQARLVIDESRPTTLKQRYRAREKTLLRVSHLRQHDIGRELIECLLDEVRLAVDQADLVVFSDFNYGCLPQTLVDGVIDRCVEQKTMTVADSQASSQMGDVSRFKGMHLITPTEHEARLAVRDSGAGLTVLADALRQKARATNVFITLGAEGLLVHAPDSANNGLATDQLPSFNTAPRDAAGAGDSLLTCASMALAVGANIWESAYLGSIAAACQVGRVGNSPLSADELIQELLL